MTEQLKPCAFCGSTNVKTHVYEGEAPDAFVQCHDCTSTGPSGEGDAGAAEAWNRRAQPQQSEVVPEDGPPGSGGWERWALEMERQRNHYMQRCDTMYEHQNGSVWYWQGDGEDHLESMGNAMLVVIRADQLRALTAQQAEAVRSEQEIVDQTEELAAMLLAWRFDHKATDPSTKLRESNHPFAESSWEMACRIQEFLTLTDPENAVAELDGQEYEAPRQAEAVPLPPQVMVDMVPPATARDRWMYEQGRLAERDPRTHAAPQQAEAVPSDVVCDKDPQGCWNVRCQLGKVCKNAALAQQKGQQ